MRHSIQPIRGGRLREGRIELLIGRSAWRGGGRKGCVTGDGGNSCGEWIKSVLVRRLELSGLVNAPKRIFVRGKLS